MNAARSAAAAKRPKNVPPELIIDWDIFNVPGGHDDVHLAWKKLHDGPDIVWTPCNGGHWIVTRGEDIDFLQRNYDPFSMKDVGVPHGSKPMRLLPLEADPPEHTGFRALINPWFTPKKIEVLGIYTRELAVKLIEGLYPAGECEFRRDFALQLPIAIFMRMTNIPWSDRDDLLEWTEWVTRGTSEQRVQGHYKMIPYILKLIADRRAHPGEDIVTDVVRGKINGKPLKEEDIVSMLLVLLFGGLDTVASAMGFAARFLAGSPTHRQQISTDSTIIPQAVEELMRRFGVAATARTLTRNYDYKGVHFKKDDKVFVPTLLYGLDERKFERPLEVDFGRPSVIHAAFGAGPHRCPGSLLARTELKVFLEAWLKRIPEFTVKSDEKVEVQSGMVSAVHYLPLVWDVK